MSAEILGGFFGWSVTGSDNFRSIGSNFESSWSRTAADWHCYSAEAAQPEAAEPEAAGADAATSAPSSFITKQSRRLLSPDGRLAAAIIEQSNTHTLTRLHTYTLTHTAMEQKSKQNKTQTYQRIINGSGGNNQRATKWLIKLMLDNIQRSNIQRATSATFNDLLADIFSFDSIVAFA